MFTNGSIIVGANGIKVSKGSHIILLYTDESELLDVLPTFFGEGIKNNDYCVMLYIELAFVYNLKKLIAQKYCFSIDEIDKKLICISYKEFYYDSGTFDQDNIINKIEKTIKQNITKNVRVFGDGVWTSEIQPEKLYSYEQEVTRKFYNSNAIFICAYKKSALTTEKLIQLTHSHTRTIYKEKNIWKASITTERAVHTKKIEELEKFNKFAINRENKMVELKQKIVELEKKLAKDQ